MAKNPPEQLSDLIQRLSLQPAELGEVGPDDGGIGPRGIQPLAQSTGLGLWGLKGLKFRALEDLRIKGSGIVGLGASGFEGLGFRFRDWGVGFLGWGNCCFPNYPNL